MSLTALPRVAEHFDQFNATRQPAAPATGRLQFAGVNGHDVYNITAPFPSAGRMIIAGRVEPRHHEYSVVMFFEEHDSVWHPVEDGPVLQLQDPFVTFVGGELIFGGVHITETDEGFSWRTEFFRGIDIFDLKPFFAGPQGMKDIRLCEIGNRRIGVFTRPQGVKGGRGTIGYIEIASLEDLTLDVVADAPLLDGMFHPMDWGGVNETHLLPDGQIGLLAHCAFYEGDIINGIRHYYACAFRFDPETRVFGDYRIIAARDQFSEGASKRDHLADVIFPSGLVRQQGRARLYAGISDAEAHWIDIADPFCGC